MTKPGKSENATPVAIPAEIPSIQDAIKAGHIERERGVVTLPAGYKTRAGTRLDHIITETYPRLKAKDLVGMLAMVNGNQDEALKFFNRQFDIQAQVPVKYRLQRTASKPKVAARQAAIKLRAAAQAMVEMGQAQNVDEAIQKIINEEVKEVKEETSDRRRG